MIKAGERSRRGFLAGAGASALAVAMPTVSVAGNQSKKRIVRDYSSTTVMIDGGRFTWRWRHHGGEAVEITLDFSSHAPGVALERLAERHHDHGRYLEMAERDPYRESHLRPVANAIAEQARLIGVAPASLALSFVQGFPYKEQRRRQLWPTETLFKHYGDCSDTGVLYGGLMEQHQATELETVGKDPIWCFVQGTCEAGHLMVGVRDHGPFRFSGWYISANGYDYHLAETTGYGFEIGDESCIRDVEVIMPRSWA